jgi:hypothetical protein
MGWALDEENNEVVDSRYVRQALSAWGLIFTKVLCKLQLVHIAPFLWCLVLGDIEGWRRSPTSVISNTLQSLTESSQ